MRLNATATRSERETRVPKRWVKFIVGVFLLPVAWVLTHAFLMCLARTTVRDTFWLTEEFWFFALGIALWLVAFFGLPRPLWLYVFGHELTHALVTWVMGGSVSRFRISRDGGYVVTDRVNTWIALAPYFIPLYSVLAVVLYGWLGLFFDVWPYRTVLYAVLGATWAFHFTFTCAMIPKGQPDLAYGGTFFSLTVIYLMNLAVLIALLILASPQVTWESFGRETLRRAVEFVTEGQTLLRQIGP